MAQLNMEIALANITHRFGDLTALEDVSLHAHEGEIVAIIGPSGCGKSTLLGIAGGILKPTAGDVVLRGVPAADTLNEITFIFQDFSLLPWLNVRDNIAFVLKHHALGAAEMERRVANALERTGLERFRVGAAEAALRRHAAARRHRARARRAARRVSHGRAVVGARCANARAVARRHPRAVGARSPDDPVRHAQFPGSDSNRRPRLRVVAPARAGARDHQHSDPALAARASPSVKRRSRSSARGYGR